MSTRANPKGTLSGRAAAAGILTQVLISGQSLSAALTTGLPRAAPDQRSFAQALCYGVLRHHERMAALAERLLKRPLKSRDQDIHALILIGLYQLIDAGTPAHAAVAETVSATRELNKAWAGGLVNAILRAFQRQSTELLRQVDQTDHVRFSHPRWLLERIRQAWPDDWELIVTANNQHPPMTLRVNRQRIERESYLERLAAADILAVATTHSDTGIRLAGPVAVDRLPGFADGLVSVQDEAAQLAAMVLDPSAQNRVLDACAAPGGKTGHLLERTPEADVLAIDIDGQRMQRVEENLSRLHLRAETLVADLTEAQQWPKQSPFDRILLDAPCSATGVIRRHPDIKYLRRPEDITALVARQSRLLDLAWRHLAPGGRLLYATCSILPDENERCITDFLTRHHEAKALELPTTWGRPASIGRQILPGQDDMDGFYYALLAKP
ncbi:MAG: 16S rRNA (cytosine(967)-C(5))-methyltransferase RsmB [Pseudomonadota bacterium]|nr:16S rRNA (cytosine(967)-C(5))-methyltransferase RsmB [Pseudomonadota bacterium]